MSVEQLEFLAGLEVREGSGRANGAEGWDLYDELIFRVVHGPEVIAGVCLRVDDAMLARLIVEELGNGGRGYGAPGVGFGEWRGNKGSKTPVIACQWMSRGLPDRKFAGAELIARVRRYGEQGKEWWGVSDPGAFMRALANVGRRKTHHRGTETQSRGLNHQEHQGHEGARS